MKLRVGTCQFPVSGDIKRNAHYVLKLMRQAKERGAEIAHFSESCLGGHVGSDLRSFKGYDWQLLENCTREIMDLARKLKLWVVVGSNHRLTGKHKPHNCLYLINDRGALVDRYDKRFLCGDARSLEHRDYTPGSHDVIFRLKGIKCGLIICHEWRYPELYRRYKKAGVQLVFHSWYDGNHSQRDYRSFGKLLGEVIRSTATDRAANNALWISGTNTSKRESCLPAFVLRPDGKFMGRLKRNVTGVLVTTVEAGKEYMDPSKNWRLRAINGGLHSGQLVRDPRSADRRAL